MCCRLESTLLFSFSLTELFNNDSKQTLHICLTEFLIISEIFYEKFVFLEKNWYIGTGFLPKILAFNEKLTLERVVISAGRHYYWAIWAFYCSVVLSRNLGARTKDLYTFVWVVKNSLKTVINCCWCAEIFIFEVIKTLELLWFLGFCQRNSIIEFCIWTLPGSFIASRAPLTRAYSRSK